MNVIRHATKCKQLMQALNHWWRHRVGTRAGERKFQIFLDNHKYITTTQHDDPLRVCLSSPYAADPHPVFHITMNNFGTNFEALVIFGTHFRIYGATIAPPRWLPKLYLYRITELAFLYGSRHASHWPTISVGFGIALSKGHGLVNSEWVERFTPLLVVCSMLHVSSSTASEVEVQYPSCFYNAFHFRLCHFQTLLFLKRWTRSANDGTQFGESAKIRILYSLYVGAFSECGSSP